MRIIQRTLLHFAAYTALLLCVYPVIALVCHYSGAGSSAWLCQLFVMVEGYIALAHIVLVRRIYRKKAVLVNTGIFAAAAAVGAAAFMLSPFSAGFLSAIAAIVTAGIYVGCTRIFFIEYDSLTHTYVYAGAAFVFTACTALIWIGDREVSQLPMMIIFLVVSGIFAAARNFGSIDTALISQGEDEISLPKGILSYNRLLLGVVAAVIVFLILFRKYIGSFLWTAVKALLRMVLFVLHKFLSLFTGRQQEAVQAPDMESSIVTQTAVSRNEWVTLICTLLAAVLTVFLLIKYRNRIADAVASFIHSIRAFAAHIFGRSYERETSLTGSGYTDYHHELTPSHTAELLKESKTPKWRRQYRRYRKMERSAEKYRLGYSLMLSCLSDIGTEVKESSTPAEILDAVPDECTYKEDIETATSGYETVRYNEKEPGENAWTSLETILRKK